jgi:aminoglycoside 3-N-acetyltransferase
MTSAPPTLVTRSQLVRDMRALGLGPGQVVMFHVSVKALGWVVGGPDEVLRALLEAISPDGTLMMYVSWEEWESSPVGSAASTRKGETPDPLPQAYLDECPPFDPLTARAMRGWSILTEYFRTLPGALRSDHPTASVVALGPQAAWLTQDHPLEYGYGRGSPFDKLCQAGGKVLLLGSPLENVTILHYAEHISGVPNKHVVVNRTPVLRDGQREWVAFEEFDTGSGIRDWDGDDYFGIIVRQYLSDGRGKTGPVGAAECHLFDAPDLVRYGIEWMERTWPE